LRGAIGTSVGTGLWRTVRPILAVVIAAGLTLCAPSGCAGPADGQAPGGPGETLVIRGSDTMVNLVAAWAEGFMSANPNLRVSVQGGGSASGFAALIDGSTDLASASRPIKVSEIKALEAKDKSAIERVVAYDAVVFIVNPHNPVSDLTMAELSGILTGGITNWKDVGGPNTEITIYGRESSSGTYAFVQEKVMGGADYVTRARLMPSTVSIAQAVAQDKTGVGYVSLGYLTSLIKIVGVAQDSVSAPVVPSAVTVLDSSYPIARSLYFYSAGAPSRSGEAFVEFCLSKIGADIASEVGFVPTGGT